MTARAAVEVHRRTETLLDGLDLREVVAPGVEVRRLGTRQPGKLAARVGRGGARSRVAGERIGE